MKYLQHEVYFVNLYIDISEKLKIGGSIYKKTILKCR